MQRCAEAEAAAAQLREQAEAAGEEEVRAVLKQLVGHVVTQKDKAYHAAAKVMMRNPSTDSPPSPPLPLHLPRSLHSPLLKTRTPC